MKRRGLAESAREACGQCGSWLVRLTRERGHARADAAHRLVVMCM